MDTKWEKLFEEKVRESCAGGPPDPAHDLAHFGRVVATAKALAQAEGARLEVVVPAAWLHDLVLVPKNDPRRSQASRLSGEAAVAWLREICYPTGLLEDVRHAIEAHSFSARIEARTLEARIVQDADRLDGVGAVGIARCFTVGALLQRPFYNPHDVFARDRAFDDGTWTLDHFYVKLFKTIDTLTTEAGRAEGRRRAATMRAFLDELGREVGQVPRRPDA